MMGSLIRRPTTLIIHGDCEVTNGSERMELSGYNVFAGSPGRKQLFLTRSWVEMTMICATDAKTVEEAENEIFAEAEQLMSRKNGSRNLVAEGRN